MTADTLTLALLALAALNLVVLGGLLVSQLVTLYATPVFFVAAERVAERLGLRRDLEPAAALAPERGPGA
jgi:hypothetical protein